MLRNTVDSLPPELKREALDYIEFLRQKYRVDAPQSPMDFAWAGGLSELRDRFGSVELQHRASDWR